jgi:hypothetical protein
LFKTVVETESLDNFLNYADGLETEEEEEDEEEDFEIVPEERILQRQAEQQEQVNGHHSNVESSETIRFQNILSESDNPEENYNHSEDEDMDGQGNIWTFD